MTNNILYDPKSSASIILYAKKLKGKTLREFNPIVTEELNLGNKGRFGQTLERIYFKYKPNSTSGPDFPEAGLELKASPLKVT